MQPLTSRDILFVSTTYGREDKVITERKQDNKPETEKRTARLHFIEPENSDLEKNEKN